MNYVKNAKTFAVCMTVLMFGLFMGLIMQVG